MSKVRLSRRAEQDIFEIAVFTIERFGIDQARHYRDGLENIFQRIAENPLMGRSAEELAPGLRRIEYESHVIFYRPKELPKAEVLIVRILHKSMNVKRHI